MILVRVAVGKSIRNAVEKINKPHRVEMNVQQRPVFEWMPVFIVKQEVIKN